MLSEGPAAADMIQQDPFCTGALVYAMHNQQDIPDVLAVSVDCTCCFKMTQGNWHKN